MTQNGFTVSELLSKGKELNDVKIEEEICIVPLEMMRTISLIKNLRFLWDFYKLCKAEKPLIVYSHTPKAGKVGMLGAKLAGVLIRLHIVAGLTLIEAKGFKRSVLDFVEKLTYSSGTKVYPNSKGLYDFILSEKFTSLSKLDVIADGSSNGINTSVFNIELFDKNELRKSIGIKKDDFVFVFVECFVSDKGIKSCF